MYYVLMCQSNVLINVHCFHCRLVYEYFRRYKTIKSDVKIKILALVTVLTCADIEVSSLIERYDKRNAVICVNLTITN